MPRTLKNTLSVLAVTAITVAVIVVVVTLFGGSYVEGDLASASASTSALSADSGQTQVMTCPRTGCTETYCHATGQGTPSGQGGSGYGSGAQGAPY